MKILWFRLALVFYFLMIGYFGFRPFKPITGLTYPKVEASITGEFQMGVALEDRKGGDRIREALGRTGTMSLEALLKTDSLGQGGPARIISLASHTMSRNFTLGQDGNGLAFRLRTSETDGNGMYPSLLVPQVFTTNRFIHVVVVYDGEQVCLYVDGKLHPVSEAVTGDFSTWGATHLLTMGDEAMGVRPWAGTVKHFSIYDRPLQLTEIEQLNNGDAVPGAVYTFPGEGTMRPLKYRNLAVPGFERFSPRDCFANIIGFVPLAPLLWLAFRKRKLMFIRALMVGFLISCTIEVSQRGIHGRVPSLSDLAYNMLGTLIGCGLLWLGFRHYESRNQVRSAKGK
ncbi:VanZ family protein [Pontiellaceae bacterium B12219]|nr:VanZ family protein [Pontiellaceae bacterium B12219]